MLPEMILSMYFIFREKRIRLPLFGRHLPPGAGIRSRSVRTRRIRKYTNYKICTGSSVNRGAEAVITRVLRVVRLMLQLFVLLGLERFRYYLGIVVLFGRPGGDVKIDSRLAEIWNSS